MAARGALPYGLAWAACTLMGSIRPRTKCRKLDSWAFHALRRFARAILKDGECCARRLRGSIGAPGQP